MALQGPQGFQVNIAAMRPSNADRGRAVDVLAAAFAEGRLDGSEHRRRVETALSATSYHELGLLTADLPVGPLPIPAMAAMQMQQYPPYPPYPPYAQVYGPPYTRGLPADGCAIASMVCALITPFTWYLFGLTSIAAIVCGHIAIARSRRYSSGSRGMAITGLIVGYLGLAVGLLILLLILVGV